jgi:hypothetical protein
MLNRFLLRLQNSKRGVRGLYGKEISWKRLRLTYGAGTSEWGKRKFFLLVFILRCVILFHVFFFFTTKPGNSQRWIYVSHGYEQEN